MKSFLEYLNESAVDTKTLDKEGLRSFVTNNELNHAHVRGILANKHLNEINGLHHLATMAGNLDHQSLGLLAYHAMQEPDTYKKSLLAYQLVNSGKLNEHSLRHIATHALNGIPHKGLFDDHLAKKIIHASADKEAMKAHIASIKG